MPGGHRCACLSGRAYYTQALDAALEADDHHAAALALGHTAQLAHHEGLSTTALHHIATVHTHADHARDLLPWLAAIEATIHADHGHHAQATEALERATAAGNSATASPVPFAGGTTLLAAAAGHVHLRAAQYPTAREALTAALDRMPSSARRANAMVRLDLASVELLAGNHQDACRHATTAADILRRAPYALGTACLRAFRQAAARPLGPRALRLLDEYLACVAAYDVTAISHSSLNRLQTCRNAIRSTEVFAALAPSSFAGGRDNCGP